MATKTNHQKRNLNFKNNKREKNKKIKSSSNEEESFNIIYAIASRGTIYLFQNTVLFLSYNDVINLSSASKYLRQTCLNRLLRVPPPRNELVNYSVLYGKKSANFEDIFINPFPKYQQQTGLFLEKLPKQDLPRFLCELNFNNNFNKPLIALSLNERNIKTIRFGKKFNQKTEKEYLSESLETLDFGNDF